MSQEERHHMKLVNTHSSGAEEWFCPSCGYRFMIQWPPEYKKIVLEPGDQNAFHSGGKGGIQMDSMEVNQVEETESNDATLQPWIEWFDKIGFESLWDQ
jgi:hypothetical protein